MGTFELLAVSVAEPEGVWREVPWDRVGLTEWGLAGDYSAAVRGQWDVNRALCVYPAEHYLAWRRELGAALDGRCFGEHLLVRGVTERSVRIGDKWLWDGCGLVVTGPCDPQVLASHFDVPEYVTQRIWETGRCGWHLRVQHPGVVPTRCGLVEYDSDPGQPTVAEAFMGSLSSVS